MKQARELVLFCLYSSPSQRFVTFGVTVMKKGGRFPKLATEYSLPAAHKTSWIIALEAHRKVLLMQDIFCFPW